jgi:hypothetical protein
MADAALRPDGSLQSCRRRGGQDAIREDAGNLHRAVAFVAQ